MADAVVLYDGKIIKLSAISNHSTFDPNNDDIMFFSHGKHKGSVKRFKLGHNTYLAIFKPNSDEFLGYYLERAFWNANLIKRSDSTTNTAAINNLGEKFIPPLFSIATDDDSVIMSYEKVYYENFTPSLIRVTKYGKDLKKNLNFKGDHSIDKYSTTLVSESDKSITNETLVRYYKFIISSKYLSNGNGALYSLGENQVNVILDIINIVDCIYNDVLLTSTLSLFNFKEILDFHLSLPTRFENISGLINHKYHDTYNEEFFARLRLGLIDFFYFVKSYGPNYTELSIDDLSVCIVNIFPEKELSQLPYSFKINLLDRIILQDNWIKGDWYFNLISEEEAIIKIIRSIANEIDGVLNYNEINNFLTYLNTKYDYTENKLLFQVLYEKINDDLIFGDDGKGARGQLINAIYLLWLESKYNPEHKVESIKNSALNNFKYTPYNAQWKYYNNLNDSSLDFQSSPAVIPYKSDKVLLWYIDNFEFVFVENKIYAYQETDKSWGAYLKDILITLATPILAPLFVEVIKYSLYGTYDIYQPIYLANYTENKTIISLPLKPNSNPCDPNSIQNNFPIFYLKYIDDLGDYSDIKNTVSTTIDVALTFTGIGNLSKLRHVGKLAHISKYSTLGSVEKEGVKRALAGLIGSIEFLSGAASIASDLITDGCTSSFPCGGAPPAEGTDAYKRYKACQTLQAWLFALEILSVTGDLLASRHFKKIDELLKDQKDDILLLEKSNAPNDQEYNAKKQEMYDILSNGSLSDLGQELSAFLSQYPDISNKLDNLQLTKSQKIVFMNDFVDNLEALVHFSANLNDIDNWKKLYLLNVPDKNVLSIVKDSILTNSFENLYTRAALKRNLNNLTKQRRLAFAEMAKNVDIHWLDRLAERPDALNRWNNSTHARAIAKQNPRIWLYIADDLPFGTSFSKVPGNSTKWQLVDLDGIVHCRFKLTGPPPKINFESYIKFKKLTVAQQDALRTSATNTFRTSAISSSNAYTTPKTHLGSQIPRSNGGNGVSPDFSGLEMAFHPKPPPYILGNGKSVIAKLSEPIENIIQKIKVSGEVKIPITGDRTLLDYNNAWRKMGIKPSDGKKLMKELKLTWHHVDDLDNNMNSTLQLVTEKAHRRTLKHSGSVKQSDVLFDAINNLN